MIKGSERRVVIVEKVDSPYFDKAIFYVRAGVRNNMSRKSLSAVAQELINKYQSDDTEPLNVASIHGGTATLRRTQKKSENTALTRLRVVRRRIVFAAGTCAVAAAAVLVKLLIF